MAVIGPGAAKTWTPIVIDDDTPWVDGYRGLFGLDTYDRFGGERAPAGPKYGRAGVRAPELERSAWLRGPGQDRAAIPPARRAGGEDRTAERRAGGGRTRPRQQDGTDARVSTPRRGHFRGRRDGGALQGAQRGPGDRRGGAVRLAAAPCGDRRHDPAQPEEAPSHEVGELRRPSSAPSP